MRRIYLAIGVCAAMAAMAVSGCNTSKGAAKDIENTGSNVEQGINASENNWNNTSSNMSNSSGMGAGMSTDNTTGDGSSTGY
ncbi:MAG: hypothetical protein ACM3OC_04650 [Deltaproteobacteria bacterium]